MVTKLGLVKQKSNLQLNFHLCLVFICLFANVLYVYWHSYTFCLLADKLTALDNVVVNIPRAVERGEDANFICSFNLFPDQILYSVKWYKGRREFFRYSPNEIPPIKTFPVPGISVFVSIRLLDVEEKI